jgi:hypothetical protein
MDLVDLIKIGLIMNALYDKKCVSHSKKGDAFFKLIYILRKQVLFRRL